LGDDYFYIKGRGKGKGKKGNRKGRGRKERGGRKYDLHPTLFLGSGS